jgi:SAM-dependent methyltransferase
VIDVRSYNRERWDRQVEEGNPWTLPVSPEVIREAREGRWDVLLTPKKPVPRNWFPPLENCRVLGLACGGGQQGPVLAAAGARVTVFDNSPRQLARDAEVAAREGLEIGLQEGDMRDLSAFADGSFDLIFHPVSNCFIHEVRPVWKEAFRVLRPGGILLAGFSNPAMYLFDGPALERGEFKVRHTLPFDPRTFDAETLAHEFSGNQPGGGRPLEFSHSLEDQLGGQLDAGFQLTNLFEDTHDDALGRRMPLFLATRAFKLATIK